MKFGIDEFGYYGEFGGAYIPEMLYANVELLRSRYLEIIQSPSFQKESSITLFLFCNIQ